jgi:hypothetical protein
MPKLNPIETALSRFKELRKIISDADAIRPEYYQLNTFLLQAYQLYPGAFDEPPELIGGTPKPPVPVPDSTQDGRELTNKPTSGLKTSDFAAWVLKVYGRMHIRELLKRMLAEGWNANPDVTKAEKTLFNTLAGHKQRFRNVGRNTWELI